MNNTTSGCCVALDLAIVLLNVKILRGKVLIVFLHWINVPKIIPSNSKNYSYYNYKRLKNRKLTKMYHAMGKARYSDVSLFDLIVYWLDFPKQARVIQIIKWMSRKFFFFETPLLIFMQTSWPEWRIKTCWVSLFVFSALDSAAWPVVFRHNLIFLPVVVVFFFLPYWEYLLHSIMIFMGYVLLTQMFDSYSSSSIFFLTKFN